MKYQHFIITLFNLKIWGEDKHNNPTQTLKWLEKRFELFEQYCLPSIKQQSTQKFKWLCLFDESTPDSYRKRMSQHITNYPNLEACYFTAEEASTFRIDDLENRCRFIRDKVSSMIDKDTEYIITTNVDNDDSLHRDMIRTLQQHFEKEPREVMFSMNLGIQYFPDLKAVMKMRYPHNHFLTIAERCDKDFCTIEFFRHAEARKQFFTKDIFEQPYWMETVHGCNVSNDLRITSRIRYTPILGNFSLYDYGISKKITARQNLKNFLWILPKYFGIIAIKKLKQKYNI